MASTAASAAPTATTAASTTVAPNGDSGTTIDPLQYDCNYDAPTCGDAQGTNSGTQVGTTYGSYNGTNVQLLYSENYYCDANVTSNATTGCEVGAGDSATPSATSSGGTGTSLGNTTHSDILYIPVPLFSNPPATQCSGKATCVDHPPTVDLSRIAAALPGNPPPSSLDNVAIPGHDHVVATRNGGLPEWWNVEVVATTSPSTFASLTSVNAINTAVANKTAIEAPTNVSLFFQVLPGTVPAATYNAAAATGFAQSAPPASLTANGATFSNLKTTCNANGSIASGTYPAQNCEQIGTTADWVGTTDGAQGADVSALYTENFFCDRSVSASSATGCEAGAPANTVPPGVSDTTPPTAANSYRGSPNLNGQIDPLYIPVPIGFTPTFEQCHAGYNCIDHPTGIDLTRLASALGAPASALTNVMLPGHDHVINTRNQNNPEWWNVLVIPVTSQAQLTAIEQAKNLTTAQEKGAVDTNAYLWFSTLPGTPPATPGPLSTSCVSHLPSGSVVGMASYNGGAGYVEVDSAGDVAVSGGAACYGSLTGLKLNQPVVGVAVDRTTGGYWLVTRDGGVFAFNAPFLGSEGGAPLNKPIVGITSTVNGHGYYLVASDGGVFSFGSAKFAGSTGAISLNKPIVGMGLDRATGGYWLVASDGGVFAYNAPFEGSTGAMALNKPVVAMAPTADGSGYDLIASDGGVFAFNAPFWGSTGNINLNKPIVGGVTNNGTSGYWMVASDGGIFSFHTPFYGSAA